MRKLDKIICPGCGWTGPKRALTPGFMACPKCGYENGAAPYRLLTIREMLDTDAEYNEVRLDLFLKSFMELMK